MHTIVNIGYQYVAASWGVLWGDLWGDLQPWSPHADSLCTKDFQLIMGRRCQYFVKSMNNLGRLRKNNGYASRSKSQEKCDQQLRPPALPTILDII